MNVIHEPRRLEATPELLTIEWQNGTVAEFSSMWLRDNRREDRDPHSGQRLVDIADLPARSRIRSANSSDGSVRIEWETEAAPAIFDLRWLSAQASNPALAHPERVPTSWLGGAGMSARRDFAWATFAQLRDDPAAKLNFLARTFLLNGRILRWPTYAFFPGASRVTLFVRASAISSMARVV